MVCLEKGNRRERYAQSGKKKRKFCEKIRLKGKGENQKGNKATLLKRHHLDDQKI